jgi:hypothetical protein
MEKAIQIVEAKIRAKEIMLKAASEKNQSRLKIEMEELVELIKLFELYKEI